MRKIIDQLFFAALSGFVFVTAAWALWGLKTPGDFFANGNRWLYPSLVIAALIGLPSGGFIRHRIFRSLIVVLALAAVCFIFFVPNGWWAHEPQ